MEVRTRKHGKVLKTSRRNGCHECATQRSSASRSASRSVSHSASASALLLPLPLTLPLLLPLTQPLTQPLLLLLPLPRHPVAATGGDYLHSTVFAC